MWITVRIFWQIGCGDRILHWNISVLKGKLIVLCPVVERLVEDDQSPRDWNGGTWNVFFWTE
jgi:hypothetical protein